MDPYNRRKMLLSLLKRRGHDTLSNLAMDFNVSPKTIRRDIDILSMKELLTIRFGRFSGGVYYVGENNASARSLNENQIIVLKKIIQLAKTKERCILSNKEMSILYSVIEDFL